MKTILIIATLFLSSCVTYTKPIKSDFIPKDNSSNGFLAVSFSQDPINSDQFIYQTITFFQKDFLGTREVLREKNRISVSASEFLQSDFDKEKGKLLLLEMKPGEYYASGPNLRPGGRNSTYSIRSRERSNAFVIYPNQVTYIGNYKTQLEYQYNAFSSNPKTISGSISNKSKRDISLLKTNYPAFSNIPVKVDVRHEQQKIQYYKLQELGVTVQ